MNRQLRPIQILNPSVAERIAAGEVIERPSSVVKELVENSIDAGATEIMVSLDDGGKALIEVTDNGFGMTPEDLMVCIERHATSKLSSLDDLEKISTLGFRGEALPSVAAVSDLSILSRREGSDTAYELTVASDPHLRGAPPKAVTFGHFLNTSHGTRIRARSLFSQVPARLKFLKAQGAEVSQVREWLERLAIAHSEIGFRLNSGERAVFSVRPQTETDRVKALLADGEDFPLLTDSSESNGLKVRAHWLQGLSSPQTRKIVQIVNGRAVRDRMLQQALLAPFRQALLPGQFPAIALFIEIDPGQIDVNVHPTKTEVRFLDSRGVFRAVESLVEKLIARHGATGFVAGPMQGTVSPDRFPHPTSQEWNFALPPSISVQEPGVQGLLSSSHPFQAAKYVGAIFNTYLIHELGEELILVDQHAAHERIRYEKLKNRRVRLAESGELPPSQALLMPEAIRFSREDRRILEGRLSVLANFGFEAEVFGEDTLLFRAVPSEWGVNELKTRLKNTVDRLISTEVESASNLVLDEALFESLASEACHSAIRAGDRLEPVEAHAVFQDLFRCEHPWNCPHGRPTVVRIPRGRFEEWFQRRV